MKKIAIAFLFCSVIGLSTVYSQDKFFTKQGRVSFDATGNLEKIDAVNKGSICVLDPKTGAIQFAILLKGFEFEKALMMEHFNENYVESDKFPKAEFKGEIGNNNEILYAKEGVYTAKVKGTLNLHGVVNEVAATGKIAVKGGKVQVNADFKIKLSDYKISIPGLVKDKISNDTKISVDCLLEPLKN